MGIAIQVQIELTPANGTSKDVRSRKEKEKKSSSMKHKVAQRSFTPEVPFYQMIGNKLRDDSLGVSMSMAAAPWQFPLTIPTLKVDKPRAYSDALAPSRGSNIRSSSQSSQIGDTCYSSVSVRTLVLSDMESCDKPTGPISKRCTYDLNDSRGIEVIHSLVAQYGTFAHMSVRDPSYSFWVNGICTAAVHFKLLNKVAVLIGNPLCPVSAMATTIEEFQRYCSKNKWKTSTLSASKELHHVARLRHWPVLRYGTEKVLNPMTNKVMLGKDGKRIRVQCRQLLDPKKGGLSLHTYIPRKGRDYALEAVFTDIYENWRGDRSATRDRQAFITVYEMFSFHDLMTFIYSRDQDGSINGFAALREMGTDSTSRGYHLDPFIQSTKAPRGTTDLLVFACLCYLNTLGVTFLALGQEPVCEPTVVCNMNNLVAGVTQKVYRHLYRRLPLSGKASFHARWKPDAEQEAGLYLIFMSDKIPSPKCLLAIMHLANVSVRNLLKADWQEFKTDLIKRRKSDGEEESGCLRILAPDIKEQLLDRR
jgi:hypothetical protein